MTTFHFRLETFLKLRQAALDQQRAKLSEAYRAEAVLKEQEREISRQLTEAREQRRSVSGEGAVNVDAALHAQRYELVLQSQQRVLAEQGQKLAEAIEQQRQRVIEADRDVKVLERLRERRLAEHNAAEQARDVKLLDEVAAVRQREKAE